MISAIITRGLVFGISYVATAGFAVGSVTALSPLIAWGIGFGGPTYLPGHGMLAQFIAPLPFDNARRIPSVTLIGGTSPPDFSVFVNGISRVAYDAAGRSGVRVGSPVGPGIRISQQIGSRATASFTIFDIAATYRPENDDAIAIYQGSTLLFRGFIQRTEEIHHHGTNAIDVTCQCADYGLMTERRVVRRKYTEFMGGLLGIIAQDICERFLTGLNIGHIFTLMSATLVGEQVFPGITVREAFDRLAQLAGCDWNIDKFGNLRFFLKTSGYTDAPASITTSSGNWRSIVVTKTSVRRANRIIVKSDRALSALWVDTVAGHTPGIFETTYAQLIPPVIRVNGVLQTVVELADIQTATYDFYYIEGGIGVFQNINGPALSSGDTIEISYPGPLPYMAIAEDTASIAAVGLFEAIVEVKGVTSKIELQAIADAELARGITEPTELLIETDTPGFEPGQRVAVNTTQPLVASDNYIIQAVDSEWIAAATPFFRHRIRASNATLQRVYDATRFYGDLRARDRLSEDRIIERVTINLAVTADPDTDGGITVGQKYAIRNAQKNGILGWATLDFFSVANGVPPTSDIVIDVFKNDVSIFAEDAKITFPAGTSDPVKEYRLVEDPLVVNVMDRFTLEVLEADGVTHNGVLELVILG